MCVIMKPKTGVDIPFAELESACTVNPDGWGVAVINDDRIEIMKGYDKKGNDAKNLDKILKEYRDQDKLVHLRFATEGDKTLENCHPFEVLTKDEHGLDIVLCHNGTFYQYDEIDKAKSDTWHINEQMYKPLLARFAKAMGPENVLTDKLLHSIIEKHRPSSTVLTFLDSNGKLLIFGKGVDRDWGWASNSYSFDRTHRETKTTTTHYGNYHYNSASSSGFPYGSSMMDDSWGFEKNQPNYEAPEEPKKDLDIKHIGAAATPKPALQLLDELILTRKTFVERAEIKNLRQLICLEPNDIEDIIFNHPEDAVILIMDLLHELYLRPEVLRHKIEEKRRAVVPTTPEMGSVVEAIKENSQLSLEQHAKDTVKGNGFVKNVIGFLNGHFEDKKRIPF